MYVPAMKYRANINQMLTYKAVVVHVCIVPYKCIYRCINDDIKYPLPKRNQVGVFVTTNPDY